MLGKERFGAGGCLDQHILLEHAEDSEPESFWGDRQNLQDFCICRVFVKKHAVEAVEVAAIF